MTAVERGAADLRSLPAIGPAAICMGVFDGVHRGHQALLGATVAAAAELGAASVALVFDPHPDEVIHPGTPRASPGAAGGRGRARSGRLASITRC